MPSSELTGWIALATFEPVGDRREDIRAAMITAHMLNCWRDPKKGKPVKVEDLVPDYGRLEEDAQKAHVKQMRDRMVGYALGTGRWRLN